jgi:hypothetical protein
MKIRNIMMLAKAVNMLFSPFYLPIVGLAALFLFSYLSMMPITYQLFVLLIVYVFTILLPRTLIKFYHRYHGWTLFELGAREKRMIPYLVSVLCYFFCYYIMMVLHVPHLMGCIVVTALATQVTCSMINLWWKISVHMAAIGAMAGVLVIFAARFSFNPVWWLCTMILLAGVLGSAQMILRQHNLHQIYGGFLIGVLVGLITVLVV